MTLVDPCFPSLTLASGLTCRVGRAIEGSAELVRDILISGRSMLLLGRPGVGKTTAIREISRILSDECGRRVVVVDTSNEIGGDGDIPHPGIGSARRMQVLKPDLQHEVLIEAVQNHTPEVVIVDEIGTELEVWSRREGIRGEEGGVWEGEVLELLVSRALSIVSPIFTSCEPIVMPVHEPFTLTQPFTYSLTPHSTLYDQSTDQRNH